MTPQKIALVRISVSSLHRDQDLLPALESCRRQIFTIHGCEFITILSLADTILFGNGRKSSKCNIFSRNDWMVRIFRTLEAGQDSLFWLLYHCRSIPAAPGLKRGDSAPRTGDAVHG